MLKMYIGNFFSDSEEDKWLSARALTLQISFHDEMCLYTNTNFILKILFVGEIFCCLSFQVFYLILPFLQSLWKLNSILKHKAKQVS